MTDKLRKFVEAQKQSKTETVKSFYGKLVLTENKNRKKYKKKITNFEKTKK